MPAAVNEDFAFLDVCVEAYLQFSELGVQRVVRLVCREHVYGFAFLVVEEGFL